jgi:hypothetical protein
MKIEKFELRGDNSVCAGAFQLLRGRAPAQFRGNIGDNLRINWPTANRSGCHHLLKRLKRW